MASLGVMWVVAALAIWALYGILLVLYRLFFHPLRNIPGPKLAAATQWTETYYECFKQPGGQFMWEYMKWHEQYGPIVRIAPNEVHIEDPSFYDELYNNTRKLRKLKHLEHRFNNSLSAFAAVEHATHRMRRSALNPFFSKAKISKYSNVIQQHMDRLCDRLAQEYTGNGKVVVLNRMWGAFTADIVVGYCFEKQYDFIMRPDFRAEFSDTLVDLLEPVHFVTQFPWMMKGLQMLPDSLVVILNPQMRSVINFNNQMKEQIIHAKEIHASGGEKAMQSGRDHSTLFAALFNSDLPKEELRTERLQHEAISIVAAGLETTMFSLTVASYHILSNPEVVRRLKAELNEAVPDPKEIPHPDVLMQLPYLTGVANECLRMGHGLSQRIPRLSPVPIVYTEKSGASHVLPVGSIIAMDNLSVHLDATIFPNPLEFRPERWENDPMAPDGRPLSKYLVPFGRGGRMCLGMSLAYAELYIGLATFFRRFDCELFETNRDAVDVYMDRFVPRPKPGTQGVRIKVMRHLVKS